MQRKGHIRTQVRGEGSHLQVQEGGLSRNQLLVFALLAPRNLRNQNSVGEVVQSGAVCYGSQQNNMLCRS